MYVQRPPGGIGVDRCGGGVLAGPCAPGMSTEARPVRIMPLPDAEVGTGRKAEEPEATPSGIAAFASWASDEAVDHDPLHASEEAAKLAKEQVASAVEVRPRGLGE